MIPKFSATNLWDFGMEAVSIITDGKQLVKRASAKNLLKYAKTKNQTDLHIIALGAYEGTGFNRNMDMFKEAECRKNYHYFSDADRAVHRHHKNKPEDPKFGNIKAAAYNEDMKRIELIVGLDNDKCADILDEQEKKGQTNWSMASKQAYDVCTWCGTKAPSDDKRCAHIPDKLGEINKEGEMCGMENPNPKWFEISYVKRPADRIGMSLQKAASDKFKPLLPSDYLQIYTGFNMPDDNDFIISKKACDKRNMLRKLSELEKHVDAISTKDKNKLPIADTEKISAEIMDEIRQLDPVRFFKAAADKSILLSPDNFYQYLFGDKIKSASIEGAKTHLKDIYSELDKEGCTLNDEKYDPTHSNLLSLQDRSLVHKLANSHSISTAHLKSRLVHNVINKTASSSMPKTNDAFDKELAKEYATYKIAALNYLDEQGRLDDDLMLAVILQNRV